MIEMHGVPKSQTQGRAKDQDQSQSRTYYIEIRMHIDNIIRQKLVTIRRKKKWNTSKVNDPIGHYLDKHKVVI